MQSDATNFLQDSGSFNKNMVKFSYMAITPISVYFGRLQYNGKSPIKKG